MVSAKHFNNELIKKGISFFTGVPCSYLTPLINDVIQREDVHYVTSSSEGEALTIATGIWLGGKMSVVMCQNSGLGNMVNPLTSLNSPFGIPVLLLITWRGKPGELDEPQHQMMGKITTHLLDLIDIPWDFFPKDESGISCSLEKAFSTITELNRPYAMILGKDSFSPESNVKSQIVETINLDEFPRRETVLKTILSYVPGNYPIIVTTGKTGRELYTLQDRNNHLYCVGSMGYANALGHGLSLTTKKKVFVIDGDGAAIMHLGNLTSIGASQAANLVHIILDNGAYDSTGGQATVSDTVNFVGIARNVGYKKTIACSSLEEFISALGQLDSYGPTLIHIRIKAGSMKQLGRPKATPYKVARRFRHFMKNSD